MTGPRRRAGLRRLGLALLLIALGGEIAVRLIESAIFGRRDGGSGALYDYVAPTGHRFKMRPSSAVRVPERYGDVVYRFNRGGYRDDEPRPESHGRRILLLGDSVSFGLGVDQDKIYAARLEARLRRELRQPWEVENLAIWAYHTGHELETLATDGLALAPRLVLVQFYMNDLSTRLETRVASPPTTGQRLTALKNRALFSSALVRRLHQAAFGLSFLLFHDLRRERFPATLNDGEPRADLAYLAATPDDDEVAAFTALSGIRDLARAHGAATLLLVSPDEVQLYSRRFDGINERVAAFCRRAGIDLVDPLPLLRARPDRWDLFLDGVHLSTLGHALYADLLFRELAGRGRSRWLLPAPQASLQLGRQEAAHGQTAGRPRLDLDRRFAAPVGRHRPVERQLGPARADEVQGHPLLGELHGLSRQEDPARIEEVGTGCEAEQGPAGLLLPDRREAKLRASRKPLGKIGVVALGAEAE
jgi:lysophospholipase L1-like esterase